MINFKILSKETEVCFEAIRCNGTKFSLLRFTRRPVDAFLWMRMHMEGRSSLLFLSLNGLFSGQQSICFATERLTLQSQIYQRLFFKGLYFRTASSILAQ